MMSGFGKLQKWFGGGGTSPKERAVKVACQECSESMKPVTMVTIALPALSPVNPMKLVPRHAPELECSMEDKASLLALTKSHTAEARTVLRARIMLACLEGKEMQQVARERKVSVPSVAKWRQRFARWGVRGLRDRARPGKPVSSMMLLSATAPWEQTPPPGRSHGDGPAVAEKLGASVPAVWRVLRREGIYLQRRRSGCVSSGPGVCSQGRGRSGVVWEPADQRGGVERGGEAQPPGHRTRLRLCGDRPWPSGTRVKKHLPASWDAASFLPPLQSARAKSPASSPHPRRGRSLAVFWRTCWPISRRMGKSTSLSTTPRRLSETTTG